MTANSSSQKRSANVKEEVDYQTANMLAAELGVPPWRIRYAIARSCGRVEAALVIGRVRYYDRDGRRQILGELADIRPQQVPEPEPEPA